MKAYPVSKEQSSYVPNYHCQRRHASHNIEMVQGGRGGDLEAAAALNSCRIG
jgi:hypothetical protein